MKSTDTAIECYSDAIEVLREIRSELSGISRTLNELVWEIRSYRQTVKACGCSTGTGSDAKGTPGAFLCEGSRDRRE